MSTYTSFTALPRGFASQSATRTVCETLAAQVRQPERHWSYDPQETKKAKARFKKTGNETIVISVLKRDGKKLVYRA